MSKEISAEQSPLDLHMQLGRLSMDPHQVIYGTIMLMTAYALFDEGQDPLGRARLMEIIGVSLAPLFALAMAHAFSEALDFQITQGKRLDWADRRHVLMHNVTYLLLAIPPSLIMIVLTVFGWDANDIVGLIQVLGLMSLAFWGAYAARKAGLGMGRQITFALSYGFMGLVVIAVELLITH